MRSFASLRVAVRRGGRGGGGKGKEVTTTGRPVASRSLTMHNLVF